MKKIAFILATLVWTMSATAQNAAQARKILDRTAAMVGNKNGASARFSMSGKYGNASGHIYIKGNKFCARTNMATIWYDGKDQWVYNKKAEEVNISHPTEELQQSMNPYKFITIYKSGFNMSTQNAGGKYLVHLTAQNKQRAIQEMYITINRSYQPSQVKMRTAKGWSVINISQFKAIKLSDSTFRFNPKDYPNAELIDLR